MDVKRLLTRGGIPFAAELVDGTESYKVFLEALGNEVILPELIKSGWKLLSLPLGLSKNGLALEQFPKMEYSPTVEEEMDMHDTLGREMPMEERRKLLSAGETRTIKLAEGKPLIFTREEFLKYLTDISPKKAAEDFLPLNYFVHPAALFSWDEYRAPENKQYLRLIEQRRHLTLGQSSNLQRWALSSGLKPDYTSTDLLSFYFQWGVCGLSTPILTRRIVERSVMYDVFRSPDALNARNPYVNDYGLIDRFQQEYRKPGTEDYQLTSSDDALRVSQSLTDNLVGVVRIRKPDMELVEEWETQDTAIEFNHRYISVGGVRNASLQVDGKYGMVHPKWWSPQAEAEMNTEMFLRAIAADMIDKRRVKCDVSSYKALCESGCSPYAALVYINDTIKPVADPLDPEPPTVIEPMDIYNFLQGGDTQAELPLEVQEAITLMLDGTTNIGKVALGFKADAMQKTDDVFAALYCAHHILGIPVKEIYKAVSAFTLDKSLTFTNGTICIKVPSSKIDNALRGFYEDKAAYRLAQATKAQGFLWVDQVARELGNGEETRHIGVRCYSVDRRRVLEDILDNLKAIYCKKCAEEITDPWQCKECESIAPIWAINSFFTGALRGYYTFPEEIPSARVALDPAVKAQWRSLVKGPFVEDTLTLSDDIIYPEFTGEWKWYCANAIIQPTKVSPRYGFFIQETSLAAVWHILEDGPVLRELYRRGLIKAGDTPWSILAVKKPLYLERVNDSSIPYYWDKSEEFRQDYSHRFKLVSPPHLLELQYPYFAQSDMDTPLAGPDEEYKYKVGYSKVLRYAPEEPEKLEGAPAPVRRFLNMSAEDFFYTNGAITMPTRKPNHSITVIEGMLFVDGKEVRPADVETLDPSTYPVAQLCGRRYLVCDKESSYWIVEV